VDPFVSDAALVLAGGWYTCLRHRGVERAGAVSRGFVGSGRAGERGAVSSGTILLVVSSGRAGASRGDGGSSAPIKNSLCQVS
jgi:hypothetical protein